MANDRNGISKGVLRAMSMFGGVQALSIICSIIRTKLVAIWIGPAGIGLFGLYNTAIDMINNIANLGIRSSSIRDISVANSKGSRKHIAEVIAVVRRWTWALGIIAAFVTLIASPLLSMWTFGDNNHTLGFIALSATIMFAAVVNCEQSILQGTGKLKRLAKTPKLYFTDPGFAAHLCRWLTPEILMEGSAAGNYFENFAVIELIKDLEYSAAPYDLTYYRDSNNKEIDLFLQLGRHIHPLEIKLSANPDKREVRKFSVLDANAIERGAGGIVCMSPSVMPIDKTDFLIPVNIL